MELIAGALQLLLELTDNFQLGFAPGGVPVHGRRGRDHFVKDDQEKTPRLHRTVNHQPDRQADYTRFAIDFEAQPARLSRLGRFAGPRVGGQQHGAQVKANAWMHGVE